VADDEPDVEFSYNTPCKRPDQKFIRKAEWIGELCESGYWNPLTHWGCSPPREKSIIISFDKKRYRVGDVIWVTVKVNNPTEDTMTAPLMVNILSHSPWNKAGEKTLLEFQKSIKIKPRSFGHVRFSYKLPLNLSSSDGYFVRAISAEKYETAFFTVDPLFNWQIKLPKSVKESEDFTAELTIVNPLKTDLKNFRADLTLPFEIKALDEVKRFIKKISPGGRATVRWRLRPQSRTVVAAFEFRVASETAGGTIIHKGLVVEGPALDNEESGRPYIPLKR
jgi:hypothetical protein